MKKTLTTFFVLFIVLPSWAQLSGTYTIGGGAPSYTNFTLAVNDLIAQGVNGPVIFDVRNGVYSEKLVIPAIVGANATNTITFQSENQDSTFVILQAIGTAALNYVVQLDSTSNIIFNKITIQNTNNTYSRVIHFEGNSDSITITNCIISCNSTTSNSTDRALVYGWGTQNGYNTFSNNVFNNGAYGILMRGVNQAVLSSDNVIYNNVFNSVRYFTIELFYQDAPQIDSNIIYMNNIYTASRGMRLYYCDNAMSIKKNIIYGAGYMGIRMQYCDGTALAQANIENNFIVTSAGYTGTTYTLYVNTCRYQNFYFNNVLNTNSSYPITYAALFSGGNNLNIYNNIFHNASAGVGMYWNANYATFLSDNNDVFSTGSNKFRLGSTSYSTALEWNTATGKDANSLTVNPNYISSTDLHVQASALDAAGVAIGGITIDIDNQVRAGPPDIGADEFTPPAALLDIAVASIDSPLSSPFCIDSFPITVRIQNNSTVVLDSVDIDWELNGVPQPTHKYYGPLAQGAFAQVNLDNTFGISGYGATYSLDVYSSNPNGQTDSVPSNDTLRISSFGWGLSGTYTIGGVLPDFATFTDAVNALSAGGVCGPVVFNVRDGTYTEQVSLPTILNANTTNTITFQSESLDSTAVILTFASVAAGTNYTLDFNGGDYYTFQKMTIQATGATYGTAILIRNWAQRNNILNNIIEGVAVNSTSTWHAVIYSSNGNDDYLNIKNNVIRNGGYGIYLRGNSTTSLERFLEIENNTITGFYYMGAYLLYMDAPIIKSNIIHNTSAITWSRGMYLQYVDNEFSIEYNKISGENQYGLYLLRCDATPTNRGVIKNNFISTSTTSSVFSYPLYIQLSYNIDLYYNNLNLPIGTATSPCVLLNSDSNMTLVNNIFANQGNGYCANINTNATTGITIDHNDYFTRGSLLGSYGATGTVATLADWQIATTQDANSLDVNPYYTTDTNLHINNATLEQAATPIAGITDDIDFQARTGNTDIGADEYVPFILDAGLLSVDSPVIIPDCSPGASNVYVTLNNNGSDTLKTAIISWSVDGVAQVDFNWVGALPIASSASINIGSVLLTPGALDTIKLWVHTPNAGVDTFPNNDTVSTIVLKGLSGIYTIGGIAPDFPDFTSAVAALDLGGICGPVIFNVRDGLYNEQITLVPINGSSTVNTVTFQSENQDSTLVTLFASATGFVGNTTIITLDGVDNIRFNRLTIDNTAPDGSFGGKVIAISNNATNIRFDNNIIDGINTTWMTAAFWSSWISTIYSVNNTATYNVFKKNVIRKGYAGLTLGSATKTSNDSIIGNIISDQIVDAIYATNIDTLSIIENTITSNTTQWYWGIYTQGCDDNLYIYKNKVSEILGLGGPGTSTNRGIAVYGSVATVTTRGKIANNVVQVGTGALRSNGITINTSSFLDIDYNSVNITSNRLNNNSALDIGIGTSNLRVRNNIFKNNGLGYAYYVTVPAALSTCDYNNIYTNGDTLCYDGTNNLATLSDWQGATGLDANSICVDPQFYDTSDLHVCHYALDEAATPIAGITEDYDGDVRDAVSPDIGADEFDATNVDAGLLDTICFGDTTTLGATASGGFGAPFTYEWRPAISLTDSTLINPQAFPVDTTTYYLIARDVRGCASATDSVLIIVNPIVVGDAGVDDSICYNTATSIGGAPTASGGSPLYTYNWSPAGSLVLNTLSNPVTNNLLVTDTFSVIITDAIGCLGYDTMRIIVNPQITADAGADDTICYNTSVSIGGAPSALGGIAGYTYAWTPAASLVDSSLANPTTTNLIATTTFYLVVTDSIQACQEFDTMTVVVNPQITADAGADDSICYNTSTTVGGTPTASGGTAAYSYAWTPATALVDSTLANPTTTNLTATTTYYLIVTDSRGCQEFDTMTVLVNPQITADAGADDTVCYNTSVGIGGAPTATGGTATYTYTWTPATSMDDSTLANPTTNSLTATTTYYVNVTDSRGCQEFDTMTVLVIPLINDYSITPDSIGLCGSDSFIINLSNSDLNVNYYLRDHSDNSIIDGPLAGTGDSLLFNTGIINSPNVYNILGTTAANNYALSFDGVDDRVDIGNVAPLSFDKDDPFTIEAWVKQEGVLGAIFSKMNFSTGYALYIQAAGQIGFLHANSLNLFLPGNQLWIQTTSIIPSDNQWHHIAATYDGSENAAGMTIYVDGVPQPVLIIKNTLTLTTINAASAMIGDRSLFDWTFTGEIDELRVWNDLRTQTEIIDNQCREISGANANLVGYWPMNNLHRSVETDNSTNSNNGTLTNMDTITSWKNSQDVCGFCTFQMTDTVIIDVHANITTPSTVEVCYGDSSFLAGAFQTTSGIYVDSLTTIYGCDSIIITDFIIKPEIKDKILTAIPSYICDSGNVVIQLDSSDLGHYYYLRDNSNDTIITGPIAGTGDSLLFNAGQIFNNMTYNINTVSVNEALDFDGIDDQLTIGNASELSFDKDDPFTIEAWVKQDGTLGAVFSKQTATTGYVIYVQAGGQVGFVHANNFNIFVAGNQLHVITTSTILSDNQWHHIAATYDGSENATGITIYVDGAIQPVSIFRNTLSLTTINASPALIGDHGTYAWDFDGKIDELRVWNDLRSSNEINNNMCNEISGSNDSSLVGYWSMVLNEVGGSSVGDSSVYSNNAILTNMDSTTDWVQGQDVCGSCSRQLSDTVIVNVYPSFSTTANDSICFGDSVLLGGAFQNTSGVYIDTFSRVSGCDSIIITTLYVNPQITADAGVDDTICYNTSLGIGGTPTAAGGTPGYTYRWSPGSDLVDSTVANPTTTKLIATTTFTVIISDAQIGCQEFDTMTILVNPQITADAGVDDTICYNTSVGIGGAPTAAGGTATYTYTWTPAANMNDSTLANPTTTNLIATTTYFVAVTDSRGCQEFDTMTVVVNPQITADAGSDDTICYNTTTSIGGTPTASGGTAAYSYAWTPATALIDSTLANPTTTNLTATTTFYLELTDSRGCQEFDTMTVLVNPQITADAGPDDTICNPIVIGGAPTAMGGTTVYTYAWIPSTGLNDSTLANPTASPLVTTTYIINLTDSRGCSATDTTIVNINSILIPDAGVNDSICYNDTIVLGGVPTASGGTPSYTYAWTPVASLNDSTLANPTTTNLTTTTTFALTITDNVLCVAVDTITITVSPQLNIDAGLDDSICYNTATSIGGAPTMSGGIAPIIYNWTPGANLVDSTLSNPTTNNLTTTTTFDLIVTDNIGCTIYDTVAIVVSSSFAADAGPDDSICQGGNTVIGTSPLITGGIPPFVYAWTPAASLNDSTLQQPAANPSATQTYVVNVTDQIGCTATDTMIVVVSPTMTADAGPDDSICQGSTILIGGSPVITAGGITPFTYAWTPATSLNDSTLQQPTANPSATQTYVVNVTDQIGCTATDTMIVVVSPTMTADAGPDDSICQGSTTLIGGAPVITAGGIVPFTYAWTPAASLNDSTLQQPTANPSATQTYIVNVTDQIGCTATDTMIVVVSPTMTADAGPDDSICQGSTILIGGSPVITAGGIVPFTYAWTPAASLNDSTLQQPTANPSATQTYVVNVTDQIGCTATDTMIVVVSPTMTADAGMDDSICQGSTTVIGGSPLVTTGGIIPFAYAWTPAASLNDSTLQQPTAGPTVTTTYIVNVTDQIGCTATDTMIVVVSGGMTADAGPDDSICQGSNTVIGASPLITAGGIAPFAYAWTPAASLNDSTLEQPTASPTVTTTYIVNVLDQTGCNIADTVIVVVSPSMTADAGTDDSICQGSTTLIGGSPVITAGGITPFTYAWMPAASLNDSTLQQPTANPSATQTYVVNVTDQIGCTATDTMIVVVSPTMTADAGVDDSICQGSTTLIGGSPVITAGGIVPFTYAWTPAASLNDSTLQQPAANPSATQTYVVNVTDQIGCTATDTMIVVVSPTMTADAGPDDSICQGSTTLIGGAPVITAGGITPFTYAWMPAASLNDSTLQQPTANPSATQTYVVNVTDQIGCTATDTIIVVVSPTMTADAGPDDSICQGSNTVIGASPIITAGGITPFTYAWMPAASLNDSTLQQPTANPSATQTYIVNVTDQIGCTATDTMIVVVSGGMTADAGPDDSICQGGNTIIGTSPLITAGGIAPFTYAWTPASTLNDSTLEQPTASPSTTTTYIVNVTDLTGCNITDTMIVVVSPTMTADAGVDDSICQGSTTLIGGAPVITAGGIVPFTYAWTPAASLNDSTLQQPTANPSATQTYVVNVTDQIGCTATDTMIVVVSPTMTADAGVDDSICQGSTTLIGGSPVITAGGIVPFTYAWTPAASLNDSTLQQPTANPSATQTYVVNVTDQIGCTATDTMIVVVSPTMTADAGVDDSICQGSTTLIGGAPVITAGGITPFTYAWMPAASLNDSTLQQPTAGPTVTTTYIVIATDQIGCTATDTMIVVVSPTMTADAGPDDSICQGSTILIGGSPVITAGGIVPFTYAWMPAASLNDSTLQQPTAGPTITTTYIVNVTDQIGCTATDTMIVVVSTGMILDAGLDDSICYSTSTTIGTSPLVTLGGIAPFSYAWLPSISLNDSTLEQPIASPLATTTYIVNVTDFIGCPASDTIIVVINPQIIPDAGLDDSVCYNTSTTIGGTPTASGGTPGYTYDWSPGVNLIDSTLANPTTNNLTTTTTFNVIITDAQIGCQEFDTMIVVVNPQIIPDAGLDDSICYNTSTVIGGTPTASGGTPGYIYNWSPGIDLIDSTLANPITNSLITTTTFYLEITDSILGCQEFDTMIVVVNPQIIPDAGLDDSICYNTSTVIGGTPTASGGTPGYTYDWSPGVNLIDSTLANPTTNNLTTTTTFNVTITDAQIGCQEFDTMIVVVNPQIIPDAGLDDSICYNTSTVIGGTPTASGGTPGYTYDWSPGVDLIDSTLANPTTNNLTTTTTFNVIITDAQIGCQEFDTMIVVVNPQIIPDAGLDDSICYNTSTVIGGTPTASGGTPGYIYNWSPGIDLIDSTLANPITNSLITTTTFYLEITDSILGCQEFDTMIVVVNPQIIPDAGLDDSICYNTSTVIGGTPTASGGTPGYTYDWSPGVDLIDSTLANPTTNSLITTTTFYLEITDSILGCQAFDTMTVVVNPQLFVDAGLPDTVCYFDSVLIMSNVSGGSPGYQYAWTPTIYLDDPTSPTPLAKPLANTIYYLLVTDTLGCTELDSVSLIYIPPLVVDAGIDTSICIGESVFLGSFPTAMDGYPSYSYIWNNGVTLDDSTNSNPLATPTSTTTYRVIVNTPVCPSDSSFITITVDPLPTVDAGLDQTILIGESANLLATGAEIYDWTPVDYLNNPTIEDPVSTPDKSITYTVIAIDSNSCSNFDTVRINVLNIYIPNTFTPNNDGANDILYVYSEVPIPNMHLMIFDRLGKLVFQSNDQTQGWDGTYKGKMLSSEIYILKLEYEFRGEILGETLDIFLAK